MGKYIIIVIVFIIILLAVLKSTRKDARLEINKLIEYLGGKDNIKTLSIDNGRVKFNLLDLDLLNQEAIKEVSNSGAFITGNNVKLLFKYDSELIVETLKNRGIN